MDITGRLAGKVALVTGGSRGIGAEIVRRLAAEGADVAFTYLTGKDEAEQVAGRVRGLGRRALALPADLGDPAAAAAVVRETVGSFGTINILVNNASTGRSGRRGNSPARLASRCWPYWVMRMSSGGSKVMSVPAIPGTRHSYGATGSSRTGRWPGKVRWSSGACWPIGAVTCTSAPQGRT